MSKVRIKPAIQKIAIPTLRSVGFEISKSTDTAYSQYYFDNEHGESIHIEIVRYGGGLRMEYHSPHRRGWFYSHDLNPEWGDAIVGEPYEDQEGLEKVMRLFMDITIQHAMPFLERLRTPVPQVTQSMYQKLSENTREKAEHFAKKWNLVIGLSEENMAAMETVLYDLRGHDYTQYKERFEENEELLIEMAAYWGESLLLLHPEGQWSWNEKAYANPPGVFAYVVKTNEILGEFDMLWFLQQFWAYSPELYAAQLKEWYQGFKRRRAILSDRF